jgi:hypothetical protein
MRRTILIAVLAAVAALAASGCAATGSSPA